MAGMKKLYLDMFMKGKSGAISNICIEFKLSDFAWTTS